MGGMKSGTGDVWGGDDEEEEAETETEDVQAQESEASESADSGFPAGDDKEDDESHSAISTRDRVSKDAAASEPTETGETSPPTTDATSSTDTDTRDEQPYIVRRMLKDKSVQYERDERLTLFVHDDVKNGEQDLQATAQDRFGRDIPVFDIREAVYRAALENPDDVLTELEEMGYTRD